MEKVKSEKVEMNISRWGSLGEPAPTNTPWLRTPQKKFGCFKLYYYYPILKLNQGVQI